MRLAYFISLTLLGFFSSPAAAAPGYWKPLLSIEEAGLDATGTHNGDTAGDQLQTHSSIPDSSVWNDAGAFLIHKTNKVLDYFIENYSEVFHASPAPKKVLNLKHVDQETPEGCLLLWNDRNLFGMRTSYLRTYEGAEKEEVDKLLHSPNLPQEFTEMVRKIDQISAKAFPQNVQLLLITKKSGENQQSSEIYSASPFSVKSSEDSNGRYQKSPGSKCRIRPHK
ncbi:hypothetical protein H4Q26_011952 [Puccinia striiformis f. sp. tritici PST-130]|nr:hypothetical protein H4Q26_011952 [Puccinia striiformis f. sp. tritici PST-130]